MPRTATQISTDLDTISAAIAQPEQEVRFSDGRSVRYYSVDEKLKAKAALQAELKEVLGQNTAGNTSVAQHRRGDGPSGPPRSWW